MSLGKNLFALSVILLLQLQSNPIYAVTDFYLTSGTATASYTEKTDSQETDLSGSEQSLSWRRLGALSFLDFGFDVGKLKISGDSNLHKVSYSSDYLNIITGISFSLYPQWIDYAFDIGYRLSVDRIKIDRETAAGGIERHQTGALGEASLYKFAIRFYLSDAFILGFNTEQKNTLLGKQVQDISPKVDSGRSSTLSVGYRFGGSAKSPRTQVESGKPNYNNPCRLFKACN